MKPDAPILLCYSGSENARHAIDVAAALFPGRHAVVLEVGPLLTASESLASVASVVPGNAFHDLNTDDALRVARDGAEHARAASLDAEPRSELASPTWEGIVNVADEIDAAVIVVGSRGLNGVREAFEGSVSHEVAEHARRPVLVVPPPPHGTSHV